ncbi:MAG: ABC transporter ATP-binding protein [Steroidobacterales bacterium]
MTIPLIDVQRLGVRYRTRQGWLQALRDVCFSVHANETIAIVGESGSGKSTIARAILRLLPAVDGAVHWQGQDLYALAPAQLRAARRDLQIVFQEPLASLDPRLSVEEIVREPLEVFRRELTTDQRSARVARVLERVGLSASVLAGYPHEFSGGQCQRIAIARAIVGSPKVLVCDEPLSALDVSIQGQILNLLAELRRELGLALVFISHNLAVVRRIAGSVLVLYLGRVMEHAASADLFAAPRHPYTRALLASIPVPDPQRARRDAPAALGEPGSALRPPSGCVFHVRCPFAVERCRREVPVLETAADGRSVACHRWREISAGA